LRMCLCCEQKASVPTAWELGGAIIETSTKINCYLTIHRSSILADSVEQLKQRKVDARFHEIVHVTLLKTEELNH